MTSQIVATLSSELPALREFLQRTFQTSVRVNSFDPDVLTWKYFSAHPGWSEPRSYVVKRNDQIVAHAGIWPLRLANAAQELKVIHMIDWAADRTVPGVGVMLLRKLAGMCDLLLTIGGSDDTRAILPKIGYRECGELKLQARVVKPLRQLHSGSFNHWKGPLRTLRNVGLSFSSIPLAPSDWSVSRVAKFSTSIQTAKTKRDLVSACSGSELNYFLKCPGAKFSGFVVSQSNQPRGYFVLGQIQGQTRIVDINIDSDKPECRSAISILAVRTAAEMTDTREVVVGSSCKQSQSIFAEIGFRVRQTLPIFCYDPRKVLGSGQISLSMLDGDLCFMANLKHPYLM